MHSMRIPDEAHRRGSPTRQSDKAKTIKSSLRSVKILWRVPPPFGSLLLVAVMQDRRFLIIFVHTVAVRYKVISG